MSIQGKRIEPQLTAWFLLALGWAVVLATCGVLVTFRAVKNSAIAAMIQFDDVPLLRFFDRNYHVFFWGALGIAGCFLIALFAVVRRAREGTGAAPGGGVRLCLLAAAFLAVAFAGSRYVIGNSGSPAILPTGILEWLLPPLAIAVSWWISGRAAHEAANGREALLLEADDALASRSSGQLLTKISAIYLIGCGSVLVFAWLAHRKFWNPAINGGYDFRPYFSAGEALDMDLVFYSTSLLFASLIASLGWLGWGALRLTCGPRDAALDADARRSRRGALLAAGVWAFAAGVPWQYKLLPEISAEQGWIMPAIVLGFTVAALMPLVCISATLLRRDLAAAGDIRPRESELALFTLLLFPFYPGIRGLRRAGQGYFSLLSAIAAAVIVAGTWTVQYLSKEFSFDDWRDMMRGGQFPFLEVLFALLAAWWCYVAGRRASLAIVRGPAPRPLVAGMRLLLVGAVAACLIAASWPFWGWHGVSNNVFARGAEFNHRHKFELGFLHTVFDFDRDGFAGVLHGADGDDGDPGIVAGGIAAKRDIAVPPDEFEVADAEKARRFPSVLLLYLEGVVPRALGCYGQRQVADATRHIDSVAAEGAIFTQARCFYPSTWDGWFAIVSGRYYRVSEMDATAGFGDRYNRYNNLHKILRLTDITRFCHADTSAYQELFVPPPQPGEVPQWDPQPGFDSRLSPEEEARDVWRGDKRNQRILDFLDSLKPGEKFFVSEHMSDTHFPWRRTSLERARELGYPEGFERFEADAVLPGGKRDDRYSCYFQTISRMDGQVGQILDKLKQLGRYDDTLIVIISDHGCQWWEHDHMYYVSHLYEQSLQVPFIFRAPPSFFPALRRGEGGQPYSRGEPVWQMDLVPTIMELAGIRVKNPHEEIPWQSRSLAPLLRGEESQATLDEYWNRDMLLTTHFDLQGVIADRYRYKLHFDRGVGTYLLFDLYEDPLELKNLADERPELLSRMLQRFQELHREQPQVLGGIKR